MKEKRLHPDQYKERSFSFGDDVSLINDSYNDHSHNNKPCKHNSHKDSPHNDYSRNLEKIVTNSRTKDILSAADEGMYRSFFLRKIMK